MLNYIFHEGGDHPLYEELYNYIRTDIINGEIKPNQKLPSKRALAEKLHLSVNTVTTAYENLKAEGFIRTEERRGYYAEDLSDYRVKSKKKERQARPECNREPEWYLDFKANELSVQLFPFTTWNRYLRETMLMEPSILGKPLPYNGLYELRLAIADMLKENRGMDADPDQIIIGAGSGYLYMRIIQLLGKDRIYAVEEPGYQKFTKITENLGQETAPVPVDDLGMNISLLKESMANVVHLSPNAHFPTGVIMPVARRLKLFWWLSEGHDRYCIEDDYDSEFRFWNRGMLPLYAENVQDRIIYMNSFTKTVVPSLRISYMVLPWKLLERYEETQSFYSCTVSTMEQYTLARFIQEGKFESHVQFMRTFYRKYRNKVLLAIRTSRLGKNSRIIEYNAGTHFLLKVYTTLPREEVARRGRDEGLALSFFSDYFSREYSEHRCCTLVINYAAIEESKLPGLIDRLEKIFEF
ncbi:MAG: PLP-dependent aminotransferase family protein [Lachnospiraceae bacterium]|nr:PLP-dependent aminotransferase family protein [Lachnospiraceae bacterium]